jgi:hypothetical protein
MEYSIEKCRGEDGPLVSGEAVSDDRFELCVDHDLVGLGERGSGESWVVRDVGGLGFASLAVSRPDADAAAAAAADLLVEWIDKHRGDLYRQL